MPQVKQDSITAEYVGAIWDLRGEHVAPSKPRKKPGAQSQTLAFHAVVKQNWLQPPLLLVHGPTATLFDYITVYIVNLLHDKTRLSRFCRYQLLLHATQHSTHSNDNFNIKSKTAGKLWSEAVSSVTKFYHVTLILTHAQLDTSGRRVVLWLTMQ